MTLRSKLNTVFGLILLVGFSLLISVILQQTRAQLVAEIDESVTRALDDSMWPLSLSEGMGANQDVGEEIFRRLDELLRGRRYLTHAEVSYRHGEEDRGNFTLSLLPTPSGVARDPAEFTLPPDHHLIHQTRDITRPDLEISVTVYADVSLAIRFQRRLLTLVISLAAVILVISLLLTSTLTRRLLTNPLGQLRTLTTRVAEGDLSVVPPWSLRNRYDELGVLANAFTAMVDNLREARYEKEALLQQLRAFNRELEDRIASATRQLGQKNQELQGANAALIDAREQLTRQERLAALGQLAGSIAHEIGTPLSTISGHLQLLMLMEELGPEALEAVGVAHGEAARMTEIIRRFLSSTRGVQPSREAIALEPFLAHSIQLTFPPGEERPYSADLYIAEDASDPHSDPGLLRQLLINLLSNARDAMESGGNLILEGRREGGYLLLHIDDDGPGIPAELRERIFEPFFTTKGPDRGTGLGLAICKEIARALQGTLSVSESPEGGARFTLRIPGWGDP